MSQNTNIRDIKIIDQLIKNEENTCAEFKNNNTNPNLIGKLCSALSNSACIENKNYAYVIWGVDDTTNEIVGTDFEPDKNINKDQVLKFKLAQKIKPSLDCEFRIVEHPDGRVVILEIPATTSVPIAFDNTAYIRIGSATPKLSSHPAQMQKLMQNLQSHVWEKGVAKSFLMADEIIQYLDVESYFTLMKKPIPASIQSILQHFEADALIEKDVGTHWNILNLGAILFAKALKDFGLERKGARFVVYNGSNKSAKVTHRKDGSRGYAVALSGLVTYIDDILPSSEEIGKIFREKQTLFPQIAIREVIANALIHQDMTISGAGVQVELFDNRLEVSNPGESLTPIERIIDLPPRSRNEAMAGLMRRMGLCEEQGSGIDKVIISIESEQLPAPKFQANDNSMQVILYAHRSFSEMTQAERLRACEQHASIEYLSERKMKNTSLCTRFGISKNNSPQVSKVIKNALKAGKIKVADADMPRAGYYPWWA